MQVFLILLCWFSSLLIVAGAKRVELTNSLAQGIKVVPKNLMKYSGCFLLIIVSILTFTQFGNVKATVFLLFWLSLTFSSTIFLLPLKHWYFIFFIIFLTILIYFYAS